MTPYYKTHASLSHTEENEPSQEGRVSLARASPGIGTLFLDVPVMCAEDVGVAIPKL